MKKDLDRREEENRRRLLFFRSGGELFAMSIADVGEIAVGPEITPVPLAPPVVAGVINHRGRIFTVSNFALLAGLKDGTAGGTAVFLHRSDMSVGVTVTAVEAIEWVPGELLDAVELPGRGSHPPWVRGILDFKGRMAGVVDADRLVDEIVRLPDNGAGDRSGAGK